MGFFRHVCKQGKTPPEEHKNPAQRRITICGVLSGISSTLGRLKFHCWRTISQNERPPSGNHRKLCLGFLPLTANETRMRANMMIPNRALGRTVMKGTIELFAYVRRSFSVRRTIGATGFCSVAVRYFRDFGQRIAVVANDDFSHVVVHDTVVVIKQIP
jgi:hypothetical protein